MISARDELKHLIDCLTDDECEKALDLLTRWWFTAPEGPQCPDCGERNLDLLVWDDDSQNVACTSCGFCWSPNEGRALK